MKKREDFQFSGRFSMALRFLRGGRLLLLCAFSACVLSVLFNFLMPQTIRVTVDSVLGEVPLDLPAPLQAWVENHGGRDFLRSNLILCAAAAVLFSLLSGIFTFLSRTAMSASCEGTLRRMRDGLFSHIQRLPYAWARRHSDGGYYPALYLRRGRGEEFSVQSAHGALPHGGSGGAGGELDVLHERLSDSGFPGFYPPGGGLFRSVLPGHFQPVPRGGRGGGRPVRSGAGKFDRRAGSAGFWEGDP